MVFEHSLRLAEEFGRREKVSCCFQIRPQTPWHVRPKLAQGSAKVNQCSSVTCLDFETTRAAISVCRGQ